MSVHAKRIWKGQSLHGHRGHGLDGLVVKDGEHPFVDLFTCIMQGPKT